MYNWCILGILVINNLMFLLINYIVRQLSQYIKVVYLKIKGNYMFYYLFGNKNII